jgi:hypothetical protein
MSRGGRGGGGSRGSTNAIADALGIQRREMAGYCNAIGKEPPPTFPVCFFVVITVINLHIYQLFKWLCCSR